MSPVATRSGAQSTADPNRGTKRASKSASDKPQKAPKTKSEEGEKPSQKQSSPAKKEKTTTSKKNGDSSDVPQVLETGVINYFVRGKVDVEELKSIDDIARGYLVLRPISKDTDLTKRPLPNDLTSRLLAVPKKELPQSTSHRFMAFVDEPNMSYSKLVEGFLAPGKHETKTAGERHVPSATPVGEGVYAITSTGNESHLAYISSLPQSKDNLHKTLGFHEKGSFLISTKNPKRPGPASARLPAPPDYPKSVLDDLGSYSFVPTKPEHLNYKNAQVLLIGHNDSSHLAKGDPKEEEKVEEELGDIAEEDFKGMKKLSSDASESIFTDLHANAKRFQDVMEKF